MHMPAETKPWSRAIHSKLLCPQERNLAKRLQCFSEIVWAIHSYRYLLRVTQKLSITITICPIRRPLHISLALPCVILTDRFSICVDFLGCSCAFDRQVFKFLLLWSRIIRKFIKQRSSTQGLHYLWSIVRKVRLPWIVNLCLCSRERKIRGMHSLISPLSLRSPQHTQIRIDQGYYQVITATSSVLNQSSSPKHLACLVS